MQKWHPNDINITMHDLTLPRIMRLIHIRRLNDWSCNPHYESSGCVHTFHLFNSKASVCPFQILITSVAQLVCCWNAYSHQGKQTLQHLHFGHFTLFSSLVTDLSDSQVHIYLACSQLSIYQTVCRHNDDNQVLSLLYPETWKPLQGQSPPH